MRNIKFRAWDKQLNKWSEIFGDYRIKDINDYTDYEICQYTGLKDKNGKEIYEGDIAECVFNGEPHIRLIVWDESELDFKGTNGKEKYGMDYDYLLSCEEIVIVGNVWENPELLSDVYGQPY